MVHVSDTGAGIAQADIPLLFSKFGTLHRTAQQNAHGIGLGLTIVKQIVECSGGTIAVESAGLGKGSLFAFSIGMKPLEKREDDIKGLLTNSSNASLQNEQHYPLEAMAKLIPIATNKNGRAVTPSNEGDASLSQQSSLKDLDSMFNTYQVKKAKEKR